MAPMSRSERPNVVWWTCRWLPSAASYEMPYGREKFSR